MKSPSIAFIGIALAALGLTGCQGKLNLVVSNVTPMDVSVVSDGRAYAVPAGAEVRIPAPYDHQFVVKRGDSAYEFHLPLNPRPYSITDYVDVHLIARIQIAALGEVVVLPKVDAPPGTPSKVLSGTEVLKQQAPSTTP